MKYSELIEFRPIEDVIQLNSADDAQKSREYVRSYVMSDRMAKILRAAVVDQLKLDAVESKGILVVGNYGTGKSHLMSVIAAVANDADNLPLLNNRNFADAMEPVAGKFEVLRLEIGGGVTMPLREIIFDEVREDFAKRGIFIDAPDFNKVRDNKKFIRDTMTAFAEKYPGRGYFLVVDEFFSYLSSRDERQIVRDLEFLRDLSETCAKSTLRIVFGVQEKIFDNPRFSFVADTLRHVSDRFTQVIITKDATSYVVSQRILKKTPAQKDFIRKHLNKFCPLYHDMNPRLEEFVDLFPIHPAYIDVFDKIHLIENRHVLKNISLAIKNIFDSDVPNDAPGVISFDDYWQAVKSDIFSTHQEIIDRVVEASGKLEDVINRSFQRQAYKPLAIKIIHALSVHRLTTNSLDLRIGLTAENLRDDLCLYLPDLPEQTDDFLLTAVRFTLKEIMRTVAGQFMVRNEDNDQFYIDVDKTIDYDENIRSKATLVTPDELNQNFYRLVLDVLKWEKQPYVQGFKIYEHDLTWRTKNIFRAGYLFLGLPEDRSTAQPERDFYVHFMPPFGVDDKPANNLPDEVYFYFKPEDDFTDKLKLYAAARDLERLNLGKDRDAYRGKADELHKFLTRDLNDKKLACFDVSCNGTRRRLIAVLRGLAGIDDTFGDTLDLAAALCLESWFSQKYPDFPAMKIKITRKNFLGLTRDAYQYFAGKKTQTPTAMLRSFDLLDGDDVVPERSRYAKYFIDRLNDLPPRGVLNFSDLFDDLGADTVDKHFKIPFYLTPIIFIAMVQSGFAEITFDDGSKLTADNLEQRLAPANISAIVADLHEFRYLSRPGKMPLDKLKRLFQILQLDAAQILDPNRQADAVKALIDRAQKLTNAAVRAQDTLNRNFDLWAEPLAQSDYIRKMKDACEKIRNEFGNYRLRFNTPAKLKNFSLDDAQLDALAESLKQLNFVREFVDFRNGCLEAVTYAAAVENVTDLNEDLTLVHRNFRVQRALILSKVKGSTAAQTVCDDIEKFKARYAETYLHRHAQNRLDHDGQARKGKIISSNAYTNLLTLSRIGIFSTAKLNDLQRDLNALQTCTDLKRDDLQKHPTCPHCHYRLSEAAVDVHEELDRLEPLPEQILREWEKILLDTLNDPLIQQNADFLNERQRRTIEDFLSDKKLPSYVNDFFVASVKDLLKNYRPIIIDADDLIRTLEELPPLDERKFRAKLDEFIKRLVEGNDPTTVRISVKRQR